MYLTLRVLALLIIFSTFLGCGAKQVVKDIFASDDDNSEPPSILVDIIATAELNKILIKLKVLKLTLLEKNINF